MICIRWMAVSVPIGIKVCVCVCCVCTSLLFFVRLFSVLGDALLCCEVVCTCGVENGALTRCDGFYW